MQNIVYIKKVDEYDDILSKKHKRFPKLIKEIIYMYKNMFNIITKKYIEDNNLWILPIQDKYSLEKVTKLIKKIAKSSENTYVISDDLCSKQLYKLMNEYDVSYLKGQKIKKYLIIKILEYICNIQNQELSNIEITILVNDVSEFNVYLIKKLARLVKNIKIVTSSIYKFKNIENELYDNYGIAIQFSNSYKKSLNKSKIIVNLDYNEIHINEYEIFDKAIIINCLEDNIKIKSKLFNGIVINSCDIKFRKEIRDKFKKINIYHRYNNLILYESIVNNEKDFNDIYEKLDKEQVIISSVIGNNGTINKNEFKNIFKKLDK